MADFRRFVTTQIDSWILKVNRKVEGWAWSDHAIASREASTDNRAPTAGKAMTIERTVDRRKMLQLAVAGVSFIMAGRSLEGTTLAARRRGKKGRVSVAGGGASPMIRTGG
jgi:hypothetical protein